jgi:hypothetical protein
MTLSIMMLSHYAECRVLFIVMLNVLNAVVLNVMAPFTLVKVVGKNVSFTLHDTFPRI